MLYSCSSLWLFLLCTCSHLLVNRLLLLGTIWFQSSALLRNGTVRHLPFGRLAASHAVGAFEHVCRIWHRRSCYTAPEIGVLIRSVWWRSVLAVVLPQWPYPASPSTRFHVFGRACQVRRTAGKYPRTSAVPSSYSRYSLDRFRLWPKCALLCRWRSNLDLV